MDTFIHFQVGGRWYDAWKVRHIIRKLREDGRNPEPSDILEHLRRRPDIVFSRPDADGFVTIRPR